MAPVMQSPPKPDTFGHSVILSSIQKSFARSFIHIPTLCAVGLGGTLVELIAFRPEGHWLEYSSSRLVGSLGRPFSYSLL